MAPVHLSLHIRFPAKISGLADVGLGGLIARASVDRLQFHEWERIEDLRIDNGIKHVDGVDNELHATEASCLLYRLLSCCRYLRIVLRLGLCNFCHLE